MEVEEFTPLTFADNGDDVLTVVRFRACSRATGKVASMHLHHWFHFRGDKIDYYRGTEDTAITLAALAARVSRHVAALSHGRRCPLG